MSAVKSLFNINLQAWKSGTLCFWNRNVVSLSLSVTLSPGDTCSDSLFPIKRRNWNVCWAFCIHFTNPPVIALLCGSLLCVFVCLCVCNKHSIRQRQQSTLLFVTHVAPGMDKKSCPEGKKFDNLVHTCVPSKSLMRSHPDPPKGEFHWILIIFFCLLGTSLFSQCSASVLEYVSVVDSACLYNFIM